MAGSLFGLGLSQQFDVNGDPMSGALLYVYLANSSTPVITYKDSGLTAGQEHTWPIEADSTGRIPAFWVDNGSYRARLTDADGNPQFDEANMLALGPSAGGGGGGDTTDPDSVLTTGDVKWRPTQGIITGWVRMNGGTIGSVTSGADSAALANQALFEFAWNNFSDAACPVVTGRGASAAADWAANKRITVLDMRGKGAFGFADMGAAATTVFDDIGFDLGDSTTEGSHGGDAVRLIQQENLPDVDLVTTIPAGEGSHTHAFASGSPAATATVGGGSLPPTGTSYAASAMSNATLPEMAGTTPTGGDDVPLQTMPPFMLGSWYWRL